MARRDGTNRDSVRPDEEENARLREDFDAYDSNKDGRLTLGEFVRFLSAFEAGVTAEEARIGFEEIDSDRDGGIEFDEFLAWWAER